jgi:hypothetical protein
LNISSKKENYEAGTLIHVQLHALIENMHVNTKIRKRKGKKSIPE